MEIPANSMSLILEICASSPLDVAIAADAGADRVELCGHWQCGGLTPTTAVVSASAEFGLPIRALIRPRAGHFNYDESERHLILAEAYDCLDAGAEKVVVGGLTHEGELDEELLRMLVDGVGGDKMVWHRAIDVCSDQLVAANILSEYGVIEVLSSGAAPAAGLGVQTLRDLSDVGLEVMAGGGVRPEDIVALGEAGVVAVHASCRKKHSFDGVESSEASSELFDMSIYPVDFEKVRALAAAVANFNS